MATKLDPIIYGSRKNVDFKQYNEGNLVKAITYDLEEFGQRGVQGLTVKTSDAKRMINYEKASRNHKDPYLMAGVCKKDLVLVVRDKDDAKFEAMTMLVKGYVDIKDKLAKQSASVTNIVPRQWPTRSRRSMTPLTPSRPQSSGSVTWMRATA